MCAYQMDIIEARELNFSEIQVYMGFKVQIWETSRKWSRWFSSAPGALYGLRLPRWEKHGVNGVNNGSTDVGGVTTFWSLK